MSKPNWAAEVARAVQSFTSGAQAKVGTAVNLETRRGLSQAIKSRAVTGPGATAVRALLAAKVPLPKSFVATWAAQVATKASEERNLIAQYVPSAALAAGRGKDPFQEAFTFLVNTKTPDGFKAAQKLLDSRAKAMREFFDGWAESMRMNAKMDKDASIRSRKRARAEQSIHDARQKLQTHFVRAYRGQPVQIPSTALWGREAAVGMQSDEGPGSALGLGRSLFSPSFGDGFEAQPLDAWKSGPHWGAGEKPTLVAPEKGIGVQTGQPQKLAYQLKTPA